MKLNMGDIMDYELNLRKADVIGLYIHYVLLAIGIQQYYKGVLYSCASIHYVDVCIFINHYIFNYQL